MTSRSWISAMASGMLMSMAETSIDLYALLGVAPDTDAAVIRRAYRQRAREHHPDLIGGPSGPMARLNAAWAVLRDPARRRAYDRDRTNIVESDPPIACPPPAPAGPLERREARASHATPTFLDFGRYAGWSLAALVREDPDYLDWLARIPIGRRYRAEIDDLLRAQPHPPHGSARSSVGWRRLFQHG